MILDYLKSRPAGATPYEIVKGTGLTHLTVSQELVELILTESVLPTPVRREVPWGLEIVFTAADRG